LGRVSFKESKILSHGEASAYLFFQNLDFFWSSSRLLLVCSTKTKRRVKEVMERGKRIPDFGPELPDFIRRQPLCQDGAYFLDTP